MSPPTSNYKPSLPIFFSFNYHPHTLFFFFFLNNPAPPEFYPLPLHDALPISTLAGFGGAAGMPDLSLQIAREYGTPAVVIDLDRVERNIARLQAACDAAGVVNRPHIKTHKRSEERRVGEECRSRWAPDHLKKK